MFIRIDKIGLARDQNRIRSDKGGRRRVYVGTGWNDEQTQVSLLCAIKGAPHPLPLDRVAGIRYFAQPRRVSQENRIAAEIETRLDDVARRARDRRHNCGLAARQCIHE